MACTITDLRPLSRPCVPQMGGLKNVYLLSAPSITQGGPRIQLAPANSGLDIVLGPGRLDYENYSTIFGIYGVSSDYDPMTAGQLVSETDGLDLAYDFVRIPLTRQEGVMTSEAQVNRDNGTVYYLNSVTIPTAGLTPEAVLLLQLLGTGGVVVIGETYDWRCLAFGFNERATLSAGSVTSGAAFGDNPGVAITLAAEERGPILAGMAMLDDEYNAYGPVNDPVLLKFLRDRALKA